MKLSKTLTVAALAAAASVSMAHAGTFYLHIAGSTAYRGATHNAIANILTNPKAAYVGSSLSGASQATFTGTYGSANWVVMTSWTGSEAGIQAVAATTGTRPTLSYLSLANTFSAVTKATAPAAITGGNAITGTPVTETDPVDACMADVFPSTTPFHGTVNGVTYGSLAGATVGTLPEGVVGCVPFKWIASAQDSQGLSYLPTSTYDGLGNMTDSLAKNAFTKFGATLSQFTGVSTDSDVTIYAIGRDHDSGTRAAAVLDTGIDKPGTSVTAIQQVYPTDINGTAIPAGNTTTTIFGVESVPPATVNGISYSAGQSGYNSGGKLADVFINPISTSFSKVAFVTYLSVGDAKTALTGNAQEMTYNGVPYSQAAVKEGQYTFWGYEHLLYLNSTTVTTNTQKVFANLIAKQIANSDAAVSGIVIDSSFHVKRDPITTDGALVIHD